MKIKIRTAKESFEESESESESKTDEIQQQEKQVEEEEQRNKSKEIVQPVEKNRELSKMQESPETQISDEETDAEINTAQKTSNNVDDLANKLPSLEISNKNSTQQPVTELSESEKLYLRALAFVLNESYVTADKVAKAIEISEELAKRIISRMQTDGYVDAKEVRRRGNSVVGHP